MHPVSTLLFLLGYGLVLPIAVRRGNLNPRHLRLALAGHQAGLAMAAVGWLLRGQVWVAAAHLAWAVVARIWFQSQAASGQKGGARNSR